MARRASRDLAVGAMFTLALLVLALAVMAVGGEVGWFHQRTGYFVTFPNADGLLVGAPVKMAGVEVGTVTDIRLPRDATGIGIRVDIAIERSHAERVREESRAALRILQLLTNEKFVEIVPGTSGPVLPEGSEIAREIETGVLERGQLIAEDLGQITASLKKILGEIDQGEGLLGQMLSDPDFGKAGLEAMGQTFENTRELTADLRKGKGVIGRLIYDEELGASLQDAGKTLESLSSVMEALGREEGAFGELVREDGAGHVAILELKDAAAALNRIVQQLEDDRGLLGRLLHDPEYATKIADDLGSAVSDVAEITGKINKGEGTLGALVHERVLYDGAEEILAGVNSSKFARWLLRHYQKKGIKTQDKKKRRSERKKRDEPPPPSEPGKPDSKAG